MLSIIIDDFPFPVIDAVKLREYCEAQGIEDWWWDRVNEIHLIGGRGPSEAHLLLPYSVVKMLAASSEGDEAGLDGGVTDQLGKNVYNRVIRLFRCIKEDEEEEGEFIVEEQDLEGWFFVSSKAIDPRRDPEADDAVHLASFTDIRGIDDHISGTLGLNINIVTSAGGGYTAEDETMYDYSWDFQDGSSTRDPLDINPFDTWQKVTDFLWGDAVRHLPNDKWIGFVPDGFEYPEIAAVTESTSGTPGNDRPHNLDMKHKQKFEGFAWYVHKLHHELLPQFDGRFSVAPIHAHTEYDELDADIADRDLRLQLGVELSKRIKYIIDHDASPNNFLVPHGYTGVFTTVTDSEERLPFTPIVLWRGFGQILLNDTTTVVEEGSAFTWNLLQDSDMFPSHFRQDHPLTLAGDNLAEDGATTPYDVVRTRTQYVDCTFFCSIKAPGESNNLNIDLEDDGLHTQSAYMFPMDELTVLIAKWHLKARLFGDLGTVVLSGFHDIEPNTRHQVVSFICKDAPLTVLEGSYDYDKPFRREPSTTGVKGLSYTGLAVVVEDATINEPASGTTGDYSDYLQTTSSGTAVKLRLNQSSFTLVPAIPEGGDITDAMVEFRHPGGDASLRAGTIISINKNGIATAISAIDYIKGAPGLSSTPRQILTKVENSEDVIWSDLADFSSVPGPPGTPGVTPTAGYAIDVAGSAVSFDPTEITGHVGGVFQLFVHFPGSSAPADPQWKAATTWDASKDQIWFNLSGDIVFKDMIQYDPTPPSDAPQLLLNQNNGFGALRWCPIQDYDEGVQQLIIHSSGDVYHGLTLKRDGIVLGKSATDPTWSWTWWELDANSLDKDTSDDAHYKLKVKCNNAKGIIADDADGVRLNGQIMMLATVIEGTVSPGAEGYALEVGYSLATVIDSGNPALVTANKIQYRNVDGLTHEINDRVMLFDSAGNPFKSGATGDRDIFGHRVEHAEDPECDTIDVVTSVFCDGDDISYGTTTISYVVC